VAEMNVVASGEPPSNTWAPLTKPLPLTLSTKLPVASEVGRIAPSAGTGLSNVTVALPTALESAALTERTVTVFGLGRLAGAVYVPDALIVPMDALPPVTPFTCQLTAVFEDPLTVAPNACVAIARTLAEFGEIVTATEAGGGFDPLGLELSL